MIRLIIAVGFLLALLIFALLSRSTAQQLPENPFLVCQMLKGGIHDKDAMLVAWEIMLLAHISKTADNIVAFPGMEEQQTVLFENGLRRAIRVDAEVRKIIDRVYAEQKK